MTDRIANVVARYLRSDDQRKRSIDFNPDLESLFDLKNLITPLSRAQKSLVKTYSLLVKLKTPKVTPDGMLGGKGFVLSVKDIKDKINSMIDELSSVTDAINDEILNNPLWKELQEKDQQDQENQEKEQQESEQVKLGPSKEDLDKGGWVSTEESADQPVDQPVDQSSEQPEKSDQF